MTEFISFCAADGCSTRIDRTLLLCDTCFAKLSLKTKADLAKLMKSQKMPISDRIWQGNGILESVKRAKAEIYAAQTRELAKG